ncbi:predicted protein [Naegleria gruberi]|uniref:Predicted protein n=1 Tax=Naegleria gruberi TaxID=5762 RepID=D2VPL5_NAEGR|nr:uncharacterized protein NAEGRDRAFT_70904 [Naegleria gruberi]EFC41145.1 predicted protein [Naegleria gruberi]|eukprot:XP_002673889.1 predicted protein [Naegleria gruberi strain NEG-M]
MASDNNFCDFHMTTLYDSLINYELFFVKHQAVANVVLSCQKTNGTNLFEERADISHLYFQKLVFYMIVMKSCSPMSLSLIQSQWSSVGFFIQSFTEKSSCLNETQPSIFGNVLIDSSHISNSVELCFHHGDCALSFSFSEKLLATNILFDSTGMFFTERVKQLHFSNYQSIGRTSRTYLTAFGRIVMKNSIFRDYVYNFPSLIIENGNVAQLSEIVALSNTIWASFRYIDNFSLKNVKVTGNQIVNVKMTSDSPITITNCNQITIADSFFNKNVGYIGGSILINEYINIDLFNNTFTNCKSFKKGGALNIENYQQSSLITQSTINIMSNTFENNWSSTVGGAISILTANQLYVKNNIFKRNAANSAGGAFAITTHVIKGELESYFEDNSVTGSFHSLNNSQYSSDSNLYLMGAGGACLILNMPQFSFVISRSVFVGNEAEKGGAVACGADSLKTSKQLVQECKFSENRASKIGNAIYFIRPQSVNVIDQEVSGDQELFSSTPTVFEILEMQPNIVFPGQSISLTVYLENVFGNVVNVTTQNIMFSAQDVFETFLRYSPNSNSSLLFTPYAKTSNVKDSVQNLTLYSEDGRLSRVLSFTLTDCPSGFIMEKTVFNSLLVYECKIDTRLNVKLLIGLIVPLGLIVLVIGIIIGLLTFLIIRFVFAQLKMLREKQKAEKSLEMRIIDKKVIFNSFENTSHNDLSIPLIDDSAEKEKKPSFIIPIESIEIIRKLAEGGLGIIYLGKLWKKINIAIKLLKSDEQDDEFEQEVSLLSSLRHDNIVTFYGICVTDQGKYMITEFVEKGSLDRTLYKARIGEIDLSLHQKISILIATAKGIEYLHSLTPVVVHRDLKPGNILLDDKNIAKICDFGLSRVVSTTTMQSVMTTNLGTLFYCPSEVIEGPTETNLASKQTATKIDVYSFAIIMWEVFFELVPYSTNVEKLIPQFEISKQEEEALKINGFNIPYYVVKGVRPFIPFKTDEQIRKWLELYMPNELKNSEIILIVKTYFTIMKQAWSHNATKRPTIDSVRSELEQLEELLRI